MRGFFKSLAFTKKEIRVVLFLVIVFTSGIVIKNYKYIFGESNMKRFDYTASDREFSDLSRREEGNRIYDAFDSNEKNPESVNELVLKLVNADDSIKRVMKSEEFENASVNFHERVNINSASKDELTDLPGIGESTADKIIIYREERNGFKKPEEIMNIKGIGKKKFHKLKEFIKTE